MGNTSQLYVQRTAEWQKKINEAMVKIVGNDEFAMLEESLEISDIKGRDVGDIDIDRVFSPIKITDDELNSLHDKEVHMPIIGMLTNEVYFGEFIRRWRARMIILSIIGQAEQRELFLSEIYGIRHDRSELAEEILQKFLKEPVQDIEFIWQAHNINSDYDYSIDRKALLEGVPEVVVMNIANYQTGSKVVHPELDLLDVEKLKKLKEVTNERLTGLYVQHYYYQRLQHWYAYAHAAYQAGEITEDQMDVVVEFYRRNNHTHDTRALIKEMHLAIAKQASYASSVDDAGTKEEVYFVAPTFEEIQAQKDKDELDKRNAENARNGALGTGVVIATAACTELLDLPKNDVADIQVEPQDIQESISTLGFDFDPTKNASTDLEIDDMIPVSGGSIDLHGPIDDAAGFGGSLGQISSLDLSITNSRQGSGDGPGTIDVDNLIPESSFVMDVDMGPEGEDSGRAFDASIPDDMLLANNTKLFNNDQIPDSSNPNKSWDEDYAEEPTGFFAKIRAFFRKFF